MTAGYDGTARIWDAESGAELETLRPGGWVLSAAFSPDGKRVVTAGRDGTARIWDCGVACDPVGVLLESVPQLAGESELGRTARYLPE